MPSVEQKWDKKRDFKSRIISIVIGQRWSGAAPREHL